jgi:hypothetical protein
LRKDGLSDWVFRKMMLFQVLHECLATGDDGSQQVRRNLVAAFRDALEQVIGFFIRPLAIEHRCVPKSFLWMCNLFGRKGVL